MARARELSAGQTALLAAAAVCVGLAVQVRNGRFHPLALLAIGVALAAVLAAVAGRPRRLPAADPGARPDRLVVSVLVAGLALQMEELFRAPVAASVRPGAWGLLPLHAGLCAACALIALLALDPPKLRRFLLPGLLLVHFSLGVWVLRHVPAGLGPDVLMFQDYATLGLMHGQNPYTIPLPNPYAGDGYYGPGLVKDGMLAFGYPYPPLPLWMAMPGQWLAHDVRASHLAASTLAGGLLARARKGRVGPLAAALLLFTPRIYYVVQLSWIEPFVLLLLALLVFTAARKPRLLPEAAGLFLASKQYLLLAVPALALLAPSWLRRGQRARPLLLVAATALAVTLPLAIWDLRAFVWSVWIVQILQPLRPDALSFLTLWSAWGGTPWPLLAFVVAPAVGALALGRLPAGPAGFSAAVAATFLAFFAFSKQAFCNYYLFVIGALCAAVASVSWGPAPPRAPPAPPAPGAPAPS